MAQGSSRDSRAQATLPATGEQAEWWQCRSIAVWAATPRNTMSHRPGLGFALDFALGLALDRWVEKP